MMATAMHGLLLSDVGASAIVGLLWFQSSFGQQIIRCCGRIRELVADSLLALEYRLAAFSRHPFILNVKFLPERSGGGAGFQCEVASTTEPNAFSMTRSRVIYWYVSVSSS